MEKKSINQFVLLLLLVACTFATSCTRRDLDLSSSDEGTVNIAFNWGNLFPGDTKPTGMKLYFYGSDGSVIEKDCSADGYSGSLPPGSYQVLVYNAGSTNVNYSGLDNYSNASASVPTVSGASNISQPSFVYGIGLQGFIVSAGQSSSATMKPYCLVKRANFKINLTGNVASVSSCTCSIGGLSNSVNIATGNVQGVSSSLSFTPSAVSSGSYESTVLFFGKTLDTENDVNVVVNFVGGGSQTVTFDISSALAKLDPTTVSIDVNLSINITGSTAFGFNATLTDWEVVYRNLDVG